MKIVIERYYIIAIIVLLTFACSKYVPGFWIFILVSRFSPLRNVQSAGRLINARRFRHAASPRDKDKLSHSVFRVRIPLFFLGTN